ncbi:hypothetical protein RsoM2USA_309 [Ralstonia phage RsoM2USA]|nr:hypothetical protein RsoM2USA_309 [Ralstonia phage RsoM2USA]
MKLNEIAMSDGEMIDYLIKNLKFKDDWYDTEWNDASEVSTTLTVNKYGVDVDAAYWLEPKRVVDIAFPIVNMIGWTGKWNIMKQCKVNMPDVSSVYVTEFNGTPADITAYFSQFQKLDDARVVIKKGVKGAINLFNALTELNSKDPMFYVTLENEKVSISKNRNSAIITIFDLAEYKTYHVDSIFDLQDWLIDHNMKDLV